MSVQFDEKCPVCDGNMASKNTVCSFKCYKEGVEKGIITVVE